MSYDEAIQFLYDLQLFGAKLGLENTRRLASLAGHPERTLKCIHVAGTNGKGSVCAMLESVYRSAGYKTGLYTSPHLVHFGERIRINSTPVDEATIVHLVERVQAMLAEGSRRGFWGPINSEAAKKDGHPTFFEVVTIMAALHFAESGCDIVLWETGMGGRLDATNIVTPLASVITNVSLEHSGYLGDTIEKITAEKSGIIKPSTPVISGADNAAVTEILRDVARSRNAPFHIASLAAEAYGSDSYQRFNAAVARKVVDVLQHQFEVNEKDLKQGLANFSFPGRLQIFERGNQTFIIDGAHNPASIRALTGSLSDGKLPTLFGCFADKELAPILKELLPAVSELHLIPIDSPRSADLNELKSRAQDLSPETPVTLHDSLANGLSVVSEKPRVLITGSLYLIGEALALLGSSEGDADERSLNDWRVSTT